jgi:hypothetical protein
VVRLTVSVEGSVPSLSADAAIRRANERVASLGVRAARMYLSRHTRSGETARNLRSRSDAREVEWYNGAPQALFLEEGTRPHVIRPRNARALRWFGPGGPIFARSVRHPGTRAQPWLEPAIRDNAGVFEGIYAGEIEEAFDRG